MNIIDVILLCLLFYFVKEKLFSAIIQFCRKNSETSVKVTDIGVKTNPQIYPPKIQIY